MPGVPFNPTLDDVRRALALSDFDVEAAWLRMAPRLRQNRRPENLNGAARPAGVLLLLYPVDSVLTFYLTRRTETVESHKGQISLPGGALENGESPAQGALRETCEELGICDLESQIQIVGQLTSLYLEVSDFQIYPVVGYVPSRPANHPAPDEVAEVLEMTLAMLLDDGLKRSERWTLRGMEVDVPFYNLHGHTLWGATAIMLSEFEGRLRAALGTAP